MTIAPIGTDGTPVQVHLYTSATGSSRPDYGLSFDVTDVIPGPNIVENIEISNFEYAGIRAWSNRPSAGFTFRNNRIHNNGVGIRIESASADSDCTIESNQIYANSSHGIQLRPQANNGEQLIQNNWIGTTSSLQEDLGNGGHGIYLEGDEVTDPRASKWTITGNTIWNNGTSPRTFGDFDGIGLMWEPDVSLDPHAAGDGNKISNNSFKGNAGLPIDLGDSNRPEENRHPYEGQNQNDALDPDGPGANRLLNHAVVTEISWFPSSGRWLITGSLDTDS